MALPDVPGDCFFGAFIDVVHEHLIEPGTYDLPKIVNLEPSEYRCCMLRRTCCADDSHLESCDHSN